MFKNARRTEERTELDARDHRALEQYLTVLDDYGRAKGADDLYVVVSQSGSEYLVDDREGACECPDFEYRGIRCKHLRRVAYATGAQAVPTDTDVDPQLGIHITTKQVATDGGTTVREAAEGAEVLTDDEYELKGVDGGVLVYRPITEWSDTLGRSRKVGSRLIGVTHVTDWTGIRSELARLGHSVGMLHQLEEFAPEEVGYERN